MAKTEVESLEPQRVRLLKTVAAFFVFGLVRKKENAKVVEDVSHRVHLNFEEKNRILRYRISY